MFKTKRANSLQSSFYFTDEMYEVRVHTADRFGAGIDAKCYIKIFGKDNISGEHELANSDNFDKFQPNQVFAMYRT